MITDGYNGVCGLAETNHGVCTDANTADAAQRRRCDDDAIAGCGYSAYVTATPTTCVGSSVPDQAKHTCFVKLPLSLFDLMQLDGDRLRVTWRMAMAYTFAAAAIRATIRVCDADHCGFVCLLVAVIDG